MADEVRSQLEEAHAAYLADLEMLGGMSDDQLAYLDGLGELPDPLTDGLECEHSLTEAGHGG
jgi:hypothetical protein